MSEVVEIYSVRGDQDIRDGALDYSHGSMTKAEAEVDAIARCKSDRTIRKVAYYLVREDDSFKVLFSYDNPDAIRMGKRPPRRQMADILPRGTGNAPKPRKKTGLVDRLIGALKE